MCCKLNKFVNFICDKSNLILSYIQSIVALSLSLSVNYNLIPIEWHVCFNLVL